MARGVKRPRLESAVPPPPLLSPEPLPPSAAQSGYLQAAMAAAAAAAAAGVQGPWSQHPLLGSWMRPQLLSPVSAAAAHVVASGHASVAVDRERKQDSDECDDSDVDDDNNSEAGSEFSG